MCSGTVPAGCGSGWAGPWLGGGGHVAEVAGHLSVAELGERFRVAADARSARHVQAIWLLAKGHAAAEVASTTAFGVRWVEKLRARYNAGGTDALGDLRRGNGARPTILKAGVAAGATGKDRRSGTGTRTTGWGPAWRTPPPTAGCGPAAMSRRGWRRSW